MIHRTSIVVAALALVACTSNETPTANVAAPPSPVSTIVIQGATHVETDVEYPQSPPIGGDHHPAWQNCGAYTEPIPDEMAVHSLEHGAAWISYDSTLGAADVARLVDLAAEQTHVLVAPYEGLTSPVVASAWGAQQAFTSAADPQIAQFIRAFQQGPQTPEPGAPCQGGIGNPS